MLYNAGDSENDESETIGTRLFILRCFDEWNLYELNNKHFLKHV